mmetsp:Transcript_90852/g.220453  ORF Transcript_90852/g.220453 Transcript_90852/m.220453 type:complete len:315 (+) Transcript_90852:415-1359(+)
MYLNTGQYGASHCIAHIGNSNSTSTTITTNVTNATRTKPITLVPRKTPGNIVVSANPPARASRLSCPRYVCLPACMDSNISRYFRKVRAITYSWQPTAHTRHSRTPTFIPIRAHAIQSCCKMPTTVKTMLTKGLALSLTTRKRAETEGDFSAVAAASVGPSSSAFPTCSTSSASWASLSRRPCLPTPQSLAMTLAESGNCAISASCTSFMCCSTSLAICLLNFTLASLSSRLTSFSMKLVVKFPSRSLAALSRFSRRSPISPFIFSFKFAFPSLRACLAWPSAACSRRWAARMPSCFASSLARSAATSFTRASE